MTRRRSTDDDPIGAIRIATALASNMTGTTLKRDSTPSVLVALDDPTRTDSEVHGPTAPGGYREEDDCEKAEHPRHDLCAAICADTEGNEQRHHNLSGDQGPQGITQISARPSSLPSSSEKECTENPDAGGFRKEGQAHLGPRGRWRGQRHTHLHDQSEEEGCADDESRLGAAVNRPTLWRKVGTTSYRTEDAWRPKRRAPRRSVEGVVALLRER